MVRVQAELESLTATNLSNRRFGIAAAVLGILLAVGLILEAAVAGKSSASLVDAVVDTAKFVGVSLLLVWALRFVGTRLMLPKVKLAQTIVDDKNVAAGIQEGLSFLLAALIVTFFLG